jgi:hypothetical protein
MLLAKYSPAANTALSGRVQNDLTIPCWKWRSPSDWRCTVLNAAVGFDGKPEGEYSYSLITFSGRRGQCELGIPLMPHLPR